MRSWGGFQAAEPLGRPRGEGLWPRPARAGEGVGDKEGEETRAENGGSSSPKRLTREPRGRAGLRLGSRRARRGLGPPPGSAPASASVTDGWVLSEEEPRLSERVCGQRGQLMSQGSDQQAPSVSNSLHWRLPPSIPSPFTLEHSSQGKVPPTPVFSHARKSALPGRGEGIWRSGRGPAGTWGVGGAGFRLTHTSRLPRCTTS